MKSATATLIEDTTESSVGIRKQLEIGLGITSIEGGNKVMNFFLDDDAVSFFTTGAESEG